MQNWDCYSCRDTDNHGLAKEETILACQFNASADVSVGEDVKEYVAHLQLHMTLQARNLIPPLTKTTDSRQLLLHQTQADFEKAVSRQSGIAGQD